MIKELDKKCEYNEKIDYSCGAPAFISTVAAQMVIENNNEKMFLSALWSNAADEIIFTANKKSLYEYDTLKKELDDECMKILDESEEVISEVSKMSNSVYSNQYKELLKMLISKMIDKGVDICIRF